MTLLAEPGLIVPPAHLWVPDHASSAGLEVVELADRYDLGCDPEQELALDAILAEREDGRWSVLEAAVVAARQNLKTHLFKLLALAFLYIFEVRLIVWTAHEFATAEEAFRDIDLIIGDTPDFAREVKSINRAHDGQHGFELYGDRRLIFRARKKTAGRGLTGDVVFFDEAFFLAGSTVGALMPTLSARRNPLILYGSSAGLVESEHLRSLRDRGRRGGDKSLTWLEWCAPAPEVACAAGERCTHFRDVPGCAADDPAKWKLANPALGRIRSNGTGITLEYVENERRGLPIEEFVRERLGWWDEPAGGLLGIPLSQWKACTNRKAPLTHQVVLGVDVDPMHTSASIVACGETLHVADHEPGTAWVAGRLLELVVSHDVAAVVLDLAGPVAALLPALQEAELPDGSHPFTVRGPDDPDGLIVLLSPSEMRQACEGLLAGVLDQTVVHRDQDVLNTAVENAGRRDVGDSWKWSRKDSTVPISPLVAATSARFVWRQFVPEVVAASAPPAPDAGADFWRPGGRLDL